MRCLADTELIQLVDGSLPPDAAAQLESHIDHCEKCFETVAAVLRGHSNVFRRSAPSLLLKSESVPRAENANGEDGMDLIGRRYLVMDLIGQGGMGQVYRALDRLTGQSVALKRVFGRAADSRLAVSTSVISQANAEAYAGCLEQEFRILATLRHPNIISVLDYGFDERRQPFFTMELLAGARPILPFAISLPEPARIELLIQLLHALGYLHRRGVLHRDARDRFAEEGSGAEAARGRNAESRAQGPAENETENGPSTC